MNFNATIYAQVVVILAIFMAAFCYFFGKRKTTTPIVTSVIGFFTAFIPPLALIYLIALVLKDDLPPKD